MTRTIILTTALASVLACPAVAQPYEARDLSVEQTMALQASPARPGGLTAEAWFDRSDATYALGESVRLFVRTNEDAYVTALSIGPTGNVTQVLPNAFNPNNAVRANVPIEIPGYGARAVVTGSLGAELVKIIVTSRPVQVVSESQLGAAAPFRSVTGGVDAVVRDLETLAAPTAAEQDIAIVNKTFRSMPPTGVASGAGTIVIVPSAAPAISAPNAYPLPTAAPSPSATFGRESLSPAAMPERVSALIPVTGARNPFSLQLASDKPTYAPAERLGVTVTAGQDCYLTVFDIDPSGLSRIAFPNQTRRDNHVAPMQTVWVSGGDAPVALRARGPNGSEQIIAACAKDAAPISSATLDFTRPFTSAGDRDTVSRDLATAQAREPGAIALASLTVSIQP